MELKPIEGPKDSARQLLRSIADNLRLDATSIWEDKTRGYLDEQRATIYEDIADCILLALDDPSAGGDNHQQHGSTPTEGHRE